VVESWLCCCYSTGIGNEIYHILTSWFQSSRYLLCSNRTKRELKQSNVILSVVVLVIYNQLCYYNFTRRGNNSCNFNSLNVNSTIKISVIVSNVVFDTSALIGMVNSFSNLDNISAVLNTTGTISSVLNSFFCCCL
jgi:hypothetical protein